jgi:OHS family lactose permease-like MFS transporter
MGAHVPFTYLYFKYLFKQDGNGFGLGMIGLFAFIQPFLGIVSGPAVGVIADKYKAGKRLLFICAVFSCIGAVFIGLPGWSGLSSWPIAARVVSVGIGIVLIGIFLSSLVPIINTETLNYLHDSGLDPRRYGNYRLLGSISWILTTVAVGFAIVVTGNITLAPIVFACGLLVFALVALTCVNAKVEPVKIPWHYLSRDREFLLFLVFAFLQSFGLTGILNFTSYFMDDLKLDFFVIGASFAVSAILEIPVMIYSRRFIVKLGNRPMILIGTGFLTLKALLLFLLAPSHNIFLIFLAMSVHGLGYAFQFNGMVDFISELAHKDLRATYMNIWSVIGFNAAGALSGIFSTFLISVSSSAWMMIANAGIAFVSIVYFMIFLLRKREKRNFVDDIGKVPEKSGD